MQEYKISNYSFERAKLLGVEIKPSKVRNKKIDVFKDGKKLVSIGNIQYLDYPTYMQHDEELAEKRRKLYLARHKHTMNVKNSPSFYASRLLW